MGVISIASYGSATLISLVAGVIYSLFSPLGPIMIVSWLVRGASTDALLKVTSTFGEGDPSPFKVSLAMTVSSFLTGLGQYFLLFKVLHLFPDTQAALALTEFAIGVAVASTLVVSFLATKYLYGRVKPILR